MNQSLTLLACCTLAASAAAAQTLQTPEDLLERNLETKDGGMTHV